MNTIPGCYIDARESRQVSAGFDIFMDMQNRGELHEYVVIALGTNGTNSYERLLTQFIEDLNPGHRLIFVTPFDGRSNDNARITREKAVWMRDLPNQYDFITIADWAALIEPRSELLANDRVHMGGQASMRLFADCIAEAIITSSMKPTK
jgi:hypothetical protein